MKKTVLLLFLFAPAYLFSQTWQLVWSDEFDTQISTDWVKETGGGNDLWGNNELENYRTANAAIENGKLVITGKKETIGGFNYTSARLKTEGKKSWQYGKMEAYIRVPFVKGTWPAFWMMGNSGDWPACGEIDIMEQVNTSNVLEGTAHWYDSNQAANDPDNYEETSSGGYTVMQNLNGNDYHLYSVIWDADSVRWYVDNVRYFKTAINGAQQTEMRQPFYLILNLAIGGDMTGNVQPEDALFPVKMYVEYVRVYQKAVVTDIAESSGASPEIILYPNPASHTLTIAGIDESATVEVFNALGSKVIEAKGSHLNIEELPSGSYAVTIHTVQGVASKKFFKH